MKIGLNAVHLDEKSFGVGEYVYNLACNLPKADPQCQFFIYTARERKRELPHEYSNARFVRTPLSGDNPFQRVITEQFYWNRRLAHDGIDVYHSPFFYLPYGIKGKVILTIHDVRFLKFPGTYKTARYFFIKEAVPRSAKRADVILASSESTKKDLVDMLGLPGSKISVVHLGVSRIFRAVKDNSLLEKIRARLGLPEKYILYIGEFSAHKNLRRIIEAYKMLKDRDKIEEKLVMVGSGRQNEAMAGLIKELGLEDHVFFTGFVSRDDLPAIYNMGRVLVFPSLYEGFGFPALEAMACGVPVVTSNISSMPEVAGDAALLVDPFKTEEIRESIYSILKDNALASDLRQRGLKRAEIFSWENTVSRTLEVYKTL